MDVGYKKSSSSSASDQSLSYFDLLLLHHRPRDQIVVVVVVSHSLHPLIYSSASLPLLLWAAIQVVVGVHWARPLYIEESWREEADGGEKQNDQK